MRAFLLLTLVATSATSSLASQNQAGPTRPNIVLVMSDDQGYGDFGVTGNPIVETPNLDAFAATCPQVERFYVSPVCSPTRACLMTGRYNYRTRVVDTWIGRSMMEPDEVTIAEALRDAGYRTGIFGKWHLGDCYPMRPMDQGFDASLVHRGGGLAQPSEPRENARRYTDPILWRNGAQVETKGYCTDVYFDGALEFIDASIAANKPFLAYVATNAPHGPFHDVPPGLHEKYRKLDLSPVRAAVNGAKPDVLAATFAMIENIDQNFGRLLAHLDARGVADDTIVVYLVDNGPVAGRTVAGLRGSKSSVYEGGIRSPLWVRWRGRLAPTTVVKQIAAHIDVMPTLLEAAGVEAPAAVELDGRSLWPLLNGRDVSWAKRHLVLQTHRGNVPVRNHHFAIVGDRWKLVRHTGFGRQQPDPRQPFELFDLIVDTGEQNDVAAQHPDVVRRLQDAYRHWFAEVSTTRPDNYQPPRIRPGHPTEPATTLTRQDWRRRGAGGWGRQGAWWLHFENKADFEVRLLFQKIRSVEKVTLYFGDQQVVIDMAASGNEISAGTHAFPAGNMDLSVECQTGEEKFAPYQVVLTKR